MPLLEDLRSFWAQINVSLHCTLSTSSEFHLKYLKKTRRTDRQQTSTCELLGLTPCS